MLPEPDAAAFPPSLRLAKQVLRNRVLAERDNLPEPARASDSQAIRARLEALPSLAAAHTLLLTLPFGSEWDTRPLAVRALQAGKRIVVPRVDRAARVLRLHAIADLDVDVVAGFLGLPEPREMQPIVEPGDVDFVLVPGVAFDASGRRVGYGGGFYDRLLPLIRAGVPRIAGAFEVQIVGEVPAGPGDQRVDAVVSPARTLVPAS
jgi:5-formyltetrahydrofolate cyclo-ligase